MAEENGEMKGLLLGLALGTVLGAVLGVILAPASGKETRGRIKDVWDTLPEKTRRTVDKIREKLQKKEDEGLPEGEARG
ncbi:MAG TPA: YtxH domain-containing protein [bacterium]|uniref:YtxH-like protein n=1 Tax=candidate division TA06 bacterium ADurb.Bin417 TaxID=1852828 RepID=A0A1V5MDJ7_UNCT6|nr:MAG: YtxH-like protein [candidate division TA06 bacterium ADurb.Bin417]HNQ36294.1 YtxH domain-containing protein [bacterium]HNS48855.1 YtxH domain-containing protein [bacterium]